MWYSASLLFESIQQKDTGESLWEESIVLLQADNGESAEQVARQIGKKREARFFATDGSESVWIFRKVERVFEILDHDLGDETEVFSRFLRNSEVRSLLQPFDD